MFPETEGSDTLRTNSFSTSVRGVILHLSIPDNSTPTAAEEAEPPVRRSSFAALRYRDFRLLWAGQFFSITGSQMQVVTINWHVYILMRPYGEKAAALALSLVGLVRVLPIVLCSLVGGVVADAVDRKRLILVTQTVMLICAAVWAAVTAAGLTQIWPIYVLTALSSAAIAFDDPARQALLPALVPARDFPNAVSLSFVSFQIALVAGAALSGVGLARYGPALVFALHRASAP